MKRYLIAGILLALGSSAGCGGERRSKSADAPPQIPQTPSVSLSPIILSAGPPLVQGLSAGQTRSYALPLEPGQYLQLAVQQRGVDVAVRVLGPTGSLLLRVDSPNGTEGPEEVFLVADTSGRHVLEVAAAEGAGRYEIHVESLRRATREDRTRAAAAAAYSRARLFAREGKSALAADGYGEAARLWSEVGGDDDRALSLLRQGKLLLDDPQRLRQGIEALHQARGLFRRLEDRHQEGLTLQFLGQGWERLGEVEPALRSYEEALAVWKAVGNLREEATCLNDLALLRVRQGRFHAAMDLYSRAIEVWKRQGDASHLATSRTNLGLLYARLGEGRLALDQYRRALADLDRSPPDLEQRAVTLNKLGDLLLWMEGPEPALERLREALELRRSLHDAYGQAVTLNSIGLAQLQADRPRESLAAFRSAVEIFLRLDNQSAQAVARTNLGIAYERLGRLRRARESYERALELFADGSEEITALYGLARVERMEGRLDEAERRMEQVLDLVEGVRSQVWRPDLRSSYQAARQKQYAFLVGRLAERRGHADKAFAVSERARARSLLDLLSAARARPHPEEVRRLADLSLRINARHRDLLSSPQEIPNTSDSELGSLLESWRQAKAEAQGPLPTAAASLSLQAAQRLLDEDTLLLEYFLDEERGYLWAVTPSAVRFVSTLPGRERIEAAARQAYDRFTRSHLQTEEVAARQAAARLSRMVLEPVADLLDRPRLVVVAHGALQSVPFAALPRPDGTDRPLIADHEVVSLPSVSVLAALRSRPAGGRPAQGLLAVVADPVLGPDDERLRKVRPVVTASLQPPSLARLPYASREAADILSLAGSRGTLAASGFEASRELVESGRLGGYRILHFATHGLFDDVYPELSALALSAFDASGRPVDGQLRAYEISGLDLHAELVVLSACRTALGRDVGGEGMVGLTQGFLHAGASRLIVSLWDVDDRSTSELMKRFYAGLLRKNLSPAQALRQAQVSLWKEARWHAPYHWAGFVLQGEWR